MQLNSTKELHKNLLVTVKLKIVIFQFILDPERFSHFIKIMTITNKTKRL